MTVLMTGVWVWCVVSIPAALLLGQVIALADRASSCLTRPGDAPRVSM